MKLTWHNYKYFPYEKELGLREIETLLGSQEIRDEGRYVDIGRPKNPSHASRLTYFSTIATSSEQPLQTQQRLLELVNGNGVKRQSTRYSAHGLHEYKGKFNPQIAKAMLNIFDAQVGQRMLDPFCGSGTSLVECAHLGVEAVGTDINPLAVFLANTKLQSLSIPSKSIVADGVEVLARAKRRRSMPDLESARGEYLNLWFPIETLRNIEHLRSAIESHGGPSTQVLSVIASNLLRDYSLQEPMDLRIRRRKSPFPSISFFEAFERAVEAFASRLDQSQQILGTETSDSRAVLIDCKNTADHPEFSQNSFDLALTSPPYATALPYIDTQRLSLVWLGLLSPSDLPTLEAELIGSREIRGKSKKSLLLDLELNSAKLPSTELQLCEELQEALTECDGFRRQVVPRLMYRYFSGMAEAFSAVKRLLKPRAPFGLIVGGNHTVLSGKRFDIDTPAHLVNIACSQGWRHIETIPLQTYQRYGLNTNNATSKEALIILRTE